MAKVSPSRSSTTVLARRVCRPGMRRPLMTIDAEGSIELTSGATTRLMTPSASTVGVKARLTPNGLNSTVILLPPPPAAPPPLPWLTEIGNSPPARKLAVSPDKATSVGSARVVTRPLFSSASSEATTFAPSKPKPLVRIPKLLVITPRLSPPAGVGGKFGSFPSVAPLPLTPPKLPLRLLTNRPVPICFNADRLISEKRTSSMTC